METFPPLTPDQRAALEAFAQANGKEWRERLNLAWIDCTEPADLKPALRQVRNTFGPSWLVEVYAWGWRPDVPAWERPVWDEKGHAAPPSAPDVARWGATFDPPEVGAKVRVRINRLGAAEVTGYFVQDGWLGVIVKLDAPPPWYEAQNGGNVPGHSFGPEIEL